MHNFNATIKALERLNPKHLDSFAVLSFGRQHALYFALMDQARRMTCADCLYARNLSIKELQILAGVRLLSITKYLADVKTLRQLYPDNNTNINTRLRRLKNKGLLASEGYGLWHITVDGNRVLSTYSDNYEQLMQKHAPMLLESVDPSVFAGDPAPA